MNKPIVIPDKNTIYWDIDDTIIIYDYNLNDIDKTVLIGQNNYEIRVLPHFKHIEEIKKAKAKNHNIVLWSASGSAWCETVMKALELERYVDLIISKPNCFYDDLPPEDFMTNRMYLDND